MPGRGGRVRPVAVVFPPLHVQATLCACQGAFGKLAVSMATLAFVMGMGMAVLLRASSFCRLGREVEVGLKEQPCRVDLPMASHVKASQRRYRL